MTFPPRTGNPFLTPKKKTMSQRAISQLVGLGIIIFVLVIGGSQATYVVDPGYRGVQVTLGNVAPDFKPEGFGLKTPFVSSIIPVSVRQRTVPFRPSATHPISSRSM